jgi:hypothetical protein
MKELTVKQISERLGYDVKIVKEQPKPPEVFYKVGDWFKRKNHGLVQLVHTGVEDMNGKKLLFEVGLYTIGGELCLRTARVNNAYKIPWSVVASLTSYPVDMKKVNVEVKEIS